MQEIRIGDCLDVMRKMDPNSIDCIVTDPPYGLHFMGKDWDHGIPSKHFWEEALRISKPGTMLLAFGGTRTYHRLTCVIEDAGWEIRDCLMWLTGQGFPKSHNFGCKCRGDAIPYSHEKTSESATESSLRSMSKTDLSSQVNAKDQQREVLLKSLPEQNSQIIRTKTECRDEIGEKSCMERGSNLQEEQGQLYRPQICEMSSGVSSDGAQGRLHNGAPISDGKTSQQNIGEDRSSSSQGSQYQEQFNRESGTISGQQNSQTHRMGACEKCGGLIGWKGYGTALKPAYEPIIMAMKPLEGTYKQNAEKWGVAGINIDDCRIRIEEDEREVMDNRSGSFDQCEDTVYKGHIGKRQEGKLFKSHAQGRWPANLLLDEEAAQALDQQSGFSKSPSKTIQGQSSKQGTIYGVDQRSQRIVDCQGDSGGASRFFYCAKASSSERNAGLEDLPLKKCGMMEDDNYAIKTGSGNLRDTKRQNFHPTVKPLALMKYLITLVMPPNPNAVVLDPFAGSGTTILAAKQLNRNAIGIELSPEYAEIARKRVESYKMPIEQFQLPLEDAKYA